MHNANICNDINIIALHCHALLEYVPACIHSVAMV